MSSLYKLTDNYTQLQEMLLSEEYDEQAVLDTLEITEFEFEEKAENYAKIMRNIDGDIVAMDAEIQRLSERKKRYEARQKVLKDNLFMAMKITGKTKFKTPMFSFSIAKNGGKQPLDVYGEVPDDYKKVIAEPDKEKIRKALESGESLEFAILQERGERLSIR
ncbi:siphovirus Gp157 family protein [Anaerotignum sp. MB30-C6]|uniref:siphovirus Gp157 family protein n=1 Tax=Anaerotignum sp. MB30-C6 TaxID=3070814 RepID=UPI0027DBE8AB|nr:siphovirus Gp157 family protein [Anaerotignum sp. MB30-C6]WMI81809.1 siphovirus Gp157 family protein [Anaerotignum sp. MB30-C6]